MAILKTIITGTTAAPSEANHIADLFTIGFDILRIAVTIADSTDSYASAHKSHLIYNWGDNDCYIAFDEVATTSKYLLAANSFLSWDGEATALHAITASGTTNVACLGLT